MSKLDRALYDNGYYKLGYVNGKGSIPYVFETGKLAALFTVLNYVFIDIVIPEESIMIYIEHEKELYSILEYVRRSLVKDKFGYKHYLRTPVTKRLIKKYFKNIEGVKIDDSDVWSALRRIYVFND
jgi:hypothetical protein